MTKLPPSLRAAYDWIDSASEWIEALRDPLYPVQAMQNAEECEQLDITESDLREVIEWFREVVAQRWVEGGALSPDQAIAAVQRDVNAR